MRTKRSGGRLYYSLTSALDEMVNFTLWLLYPYTTATDTHCGHHGLFVNALKMKTTKTTCPCE
jgi:hypothetical protein